MSPDVASIPLSAGIGETTDTAPRGGCEALKLEVARVLVTHGARRDALAGPGESLVELAARNGDKDMVWFLVTSPRRRLSSGFTEPLMQLIHSDHIHRTQAVLSGLELPSSFSRSSFIDALNAAIELDVSGDVVQSVLNIGASLLQETEAP